MSRKTSPRPQPTEVLLKKIADKLQQLSRPDNVKQRESLTLNALVTRDLWDVWEMFRILTLRIRDLEANAVRRPDPELIKALAKLPSLKRGDS